MNEQIESLLQLQLKRKRIQNFLTGSLALLISLGAVVLVILEPQYLKFVAMLFVMGLIFLMATNAMEFDPSEPDGGENKAKANGCFFSIVLIFVGLWTISSLLAAIASTENYEFAIGFGVFLVLSAWFYPKIDELTARRHPEIWRLEYECGICNSGCYNEGKYCCPVCDFISSSQKYSGLRQHYTKSHKDIASKLRLFRKVCAECQTHDKIKRKPGPTR